jgi:hypothetical protein
VWHPVHASTYVADATARHTALLLSCKWTAHVCANRKVLRRQQGVTAAGCLGSDIFNDGGVHLHGYGVHALRPQPQRPEGLRGVSF